MGTYDALTKEIQEGIDQLKKEQRLDKVMQVTISGKQGPEFSLSPTKKAASSEEETDR